MSISSLIVRTQCASTEKVRRAINELPHAEVTDAKGENLVVVTDSSLPAEDKSVWKSIERIPGVVQVDLVYHNFEDAAGEQNDEKIPDA
ncbi:MAG: chaperone NapD [Elusimicrobiota bacterium]